METVMIFLAALGGFLAAFYIYWKRTNGKMVCMIGEDCDDVLRSKYATIFFGIPNEVAGALYFVAILTFLIGRGYLDLFMAPVFDTLFVLGTGIGALYAFYLIGIQAFILRKWCEKCLILSFFTFLTFALVLFF